MHARIFAGAISCVDVLQNKGQSSFNWEGDLKQMLKDDAVFQSNICTIEWNLTRMRIGRSRGAPYC